MLETKRDVANYREIASALLAHDHAWTTKNASICQKINVSSTPVLLEMDGMNVHRELHVLTKDAVREFLGTEQPIHDQRAKPDAVSTPSASAEATDISGTSYSSNTFIGIIMFVLLIVVIAAIVLLFLLTSQDESVHDSAEAFLRREDVSRDDELDRDGNDLEMPDADFNPHKGD